MNTTHRLLAVNTLLLSATELFTRVVSLLLVIAVARHLGPALMGIYAFALTFVNLFEVCINFGLDRYIQREVGRAPAEAARLSQQVFSLKVVMFLTAGAIILGLSFLTMEPGLKRWIVWLLTLALFFRTQTAFHTAFFRARQHADYEARVVVSFRLGYGLAGLAAILAGCGLLTLVLLELSAQAGAWLVSWLLLQRHIARPKVWFRLTGIWDLARQAREFFFLRLVLVAFSSTNLLLLSWLAGDSAAGYYAAALRLAAAGDFLPEAFSGAFLPVLSRGFAQGPEAFGDILRRYCKYLLLVGAGITVCLTGLAHPLIRFIYGADFGPAAPLLAIMGLTLSLDFLNVALSNALIAQNAEVRMVRTFALGAVGNALLVLLLLPSWGANGAALAALFAELAILGIQLHLLGWQQLRSLGLAAVTGRPLLAALASLTGAHYLSLWLPSLWLNLPLTALGYLLLLGLTGSLTWSEIRQLRELIPVPGKNRALSPSPEG